MSVPAIVLMFVAVATITGVSLLDHAAHAAAVDLAELRADRAAAALTDSCLSDTGCALPPGVEACTAPNGVLVTATVTFDARIWTHIDATTASRVVAYNAGTGADTTLAAGIAAAADAC